MKKIPLNYLTLRFQSINLENRYKVTSSKGSLKIVRIGILLAVSLYLIFGILDLWMIPESLAVVWGIRLAVSLILMFIFFLSFKVIFRKYIQMFLVIITLVLAGGIIYMVLLSEYEGLFYYAGLMLVIQFANGLIRLRFIYAAITTIFISIFYLLIAWGIRNTPGTLVINNSFFLFSTIIIGMFINYSLEYYMRYTFFQKEILVRQQNQIREEHKRKSIELENIRQLQLAILPAKTLIHPSIDMSISFNTATEVGGDYYDYYIDEGKTITFTIGDAIGHGAQAGALVAALKVLFNNCSQNKDILEFVNQASAAIKQLGVPRLFMPLIVGRIAGSGLELAGGGLPPALFYEYASKTVEEISLKGFPLGCVTNYPYKKIPLSLGQGDVLLFMTDGFPELFNYKNEMLGSEKIKSIFGQVVNENPSDITEHLNREIESWRGHRPLIDDLTFIVFKIKNTL